MEYTWRSLKDAAIDTGLEQPELGMKMLKHSAAWAQEVAELRELCKLLNQHANKFDFEGTSSEDEKRAHELWAKHITKHMKGAGGK